MKSLYIYLLFLLYIASQSEAMDCPLNGVDFSGNDLACIDEVSSWQECGRLCHYMTFPEPCNYWTWFEGWKNGCCMKSSDNGLQNRDKHISGDSNCY